MTETVKNYVLEKLGTGAGVGWFSCVPEDAPGLEECLHHLSAAPWDRFMHGYALELLKEAPLEEIENLIERGTSGEPHLLALVFEACSTKQDLNELLNRFTDADIQAAAGHTPRITIHFGKQEPPGWRLYWLKVFSRNILLHEELPPPGKAQFAAPVEPREIEAWKENTLHISQAPFARELPGKKPEKTSPPSRKEIGRLQGLLERLGVLEGWESRTEATLSPYAVERPWRLDVRVGNGRNSWRLRGVQTGYGRGLNIHQARMSCLMEIAERYSAFVSVQGEKAPGFARGHRLIRGTRKALQEEGFRLVDPRRMRLEVPFRDESLHWMKGEAVTSDGPRETLVPFQLVSLFSNLDETDLTSGITSTGLGAGATVEQARLSALLEVVERDAERIMPYTPSRCFTLESADDKVHGMLSEWTAKGIHVRFLDITPEMGIPCYKAFVEAPGGVVLKGCGAALNGAHAAVSAMTEIPWPYPYWFGTAPAPEDTPVRALEDLPNWSTGDAARDLVNLESLLLRNGYEPVYVDLTREDTGIPVCRALVAGLEMMTFFDRYTPLGFRQFAQYLEAAGTHP